MRFILPTPTSSRASVSRFPENISKIISSAKHFDSNQTRNNKGKPTMKINQTNQIRIARRTALGRTLCRLAGDRTGAVMMEYVILGVLIAAAATLAAIYFGKIVRFNAA